MVFTSVFDINAVLFAYLTYNSIKKIFLLNKAGNNLIGNVFNSEIFVCFEKNNNYIYENGYVTVIKLMLNDISYKIDWFNSMTALKNGHLKIYKLLKNVNNKSKIIKNCKNLLY